MFAWMLLFAALSSTTVKDGLWSDPGTWDRPPGGLVEPVKILHKVELTGSAECGDIELSKGLLRLADGSRLKCGSVVVQGEAALLAGVLGAPVAAEVIFRDLPIDLAADPEQIGRGLVVYGVCRIFGHERAAFERSAVDLMPGDLRIPVGGRGWLPGDTLWLADTRQPDSADGPTGEQSEPVQIKAIRPDGVELVTGPRYRHACPRRATGAYAGGFPVANLTRSVVFRSENPRGVRGHFLATMAADIEIHGAAFLDMGRTTSAFLNDTARDATGKIVKIGTNQRGRYPVHFHHLMGPMADRPFQFVFEGNAVYSTVPVNRWSITVHQSHWGLVANNVCVGAWGSGIVTEDGNESFNEITGNYVANILGRSRPDQRPNEIGTEGVCLWFAGGNNRVNDNVGCASAAGVTYYARFRQTYKRPAKPGEMPEIPVNPNSTPILQCSGNEILGCGTGFSSWWIGVHDQTPLPQTGWSTIENLFCWNTKSGFSNYESGYFLVVNYRCLGDKTKANDNTGGFGANDYLQYSVVIENVLIEGMNSGITAGAINDVRGASGCNPGIFIVRGGSLCNRVNIQTQTPWFNAKPGVERLPPTIVHLQNVRMELLTKDSRHFNLGKDPGEFANRSQWVAVFTAGVPVIQLYSDKQKPGAAASPTTASAVGVPVAGLTNKQAWDIYGQCTAGELVPPGALSFSSTGTFIFRDPNKPVIRPIGSVQVKPGSQWAQDAMCYNPNLRGVEWSVTGPEGLTISQDGKLKWPVPALEGTGPKDYKVTVTATDLLEVKYRSSITFTLRVAMPSG